MAANEIQERRAEQASEDDLGHRALDLVPGMVAKRKDFGMAWNEALEAGGLLVGDEVEISLDVEAVPAK